MLMTPTRKPEILKDNSSLIMPRSMLKSMIHLLEKLHHCQKRLMHPQVTQQPQVTRAQVTQDLELPPVIEVI